MSDTQIKCLAMAILLGAPEKQVFRGQLIYAAVNANRFVDATEILIIAAAEHIGSDWSGQCMQLAEQCYRRCEHPSSHPKKVLIAALLGLRGRRDGLDAVDINAAIYLASVHLDRGHSSAKALAEGRQFLSALTPRPGNRPDSAAPAHPPAGDEA